MLTHDETQLRDALHALAHGQSHPALITHHYTPPPPGTTAFLFSGQGTQRHQMGRDLYHTHPTFAHHLDHIAAQFPLNPPLKTVMFAPEHHPHAHLLHTTQYTQPALFTYHTALAHLLKHHHITPDYLTGHSIGLYAAAHHAGILTLPDATTLITTRATLMATMPPGAMTAIHATEEEITPTLLPDTAIAATNTPTTTIISGNPHNIATITHHWHTQGRKTTPLNVNHAYHSPHTDPILKPFHHTAQTITYHPPTTPILCNLTGQLADPHHITTPHYWTTHIRQPVRHTQTLTTLHQLGATTHHHLTPHPHTLATLHTHTNLPWPPHPHHAQPPTYPFQHHHYWLNPPPLPTEQQREWSVQDRWRYRVAWRPVEARPHAPLPSRWLLVFSETVADDVPRLVEQALGERGAQVERLLVDPAEASREWFAERLRAYDGGDVLSLLAFDEGQHPDRPGLPHGVAATMALAQAVSDVPLNGRLWAVTRGAVSTGNGDPSLSPGQAQVWGLGRSIALEQPEQWGGLVDLPDLMTDAASRDLVKALTGDEDQVALRSSGMLARRLVRAPLLEGTVEDGRWRPAGTVLITGGTGGIGAQVARWFAGNGAEHLLLASRRGPDAPGAAELEAELTALGSKVSIVACDLASRAEVERMLACVPQDTPLTAVVHAAGAAQRLAPVSALTRDEFAEVISGKVAGAVHLDELLGDAPLDAFVLFSSSAGVWGSGGNGVYAAGNAFLDLFAEQRRARRRTATSIAWGVWDGAGMRGVEDAGDYMDRRGVVAMAPEQAITAMMCAIERDETCLTVADIDWSRFAPSFTSGRPSPLLAELPEVRETVGEPAAAASVAVPDLSTMTAQEQLAFLVDLVTNEVTTVLRREPGDEVAADRAFKELGFDSLTSVELRNRLATATNLQLGAGLVFDHPTPLALAKYLQNELVPDQVSLLQRELDALERSLSTLAADPTVTARFAQRLEAMARMVRDNDAGQLPSTDLADDMDTASATEIFDLIDRELGYSPEDWSSTTEGNDGNG
nr:type I polyketide synthase [Nonomuraea polychroma]